VTLRPLHNHPLRTLAAMLLLALALFLLSASGAPGTYWSDGPVWLGTVCWFGWMIVFLLFVVTAAYSMVRSVVRRWRAS
jgi:hypothetical protein